MAEPTDDTAVYEPGVFEGAVASDEAQALIDAMQAELAELRAKGEALDAKLAQLDTLVDGVPDEPPPVDPPEDPPVDPPEDPPVDPPPVDPPPPGAKRDPVSGLPWRSGFGQCADQLKALEGLRKRPAGAFAAWSNFGVVNNWIGIRGGNLGKLDERKGIFSTDGAYNWHSANQKRLIHPKALKIWIVPFLHQQLSNAAKLRKDPHGNVTGVDWTHPKVWEELADPQRRRPELIVNWKEHGQRLGLMLQEYEIDPALFVEVLGHESTGWWYFWSVGPDLENYKLVFKLAVDAIRAGLRETFPSGWAKVRFEMRLAGESKFVPWKATDAFPGNEHAAILGCSLHGGKDSLGVEKFWQQELRGTSSKIGLEVALQMARANKVPLGLDEWGIVRKGDDKHHPADPHPEQAVKNSLGWIAKNAADISHECWLYSQSKYDLLAGAREKWGGTKGYLAMIDAAAKAAKRTA